MASLLAYDDLVYLTPGRKTILDFDFVDEIPVGDTIKAVGNGTSVTARDISGTPALIVSDVQIVGSTKLQATINDIIEGEDYMLEYIIRTEISGEEFDKFRVVRARTRGLVI